MSLIGNKDTIKDTLILNLKPIARTPRLTIRSDEAARRKIADTDGTKRRARRTAEENRLI